MSLRGEDTEPSQIFGILKTPKVVFTDFDTMFMSGLLELQYGQDVEDKLRGISKNVSWADGWPENKQSFWKGFYRILRLNSKILRNIR